MAPNRQTSNRQMARNQLERKMPTMQNRPTRQMQLVHRKMSLTPNLIFCQQNGDNHRLPPSRREPPDLNHPPSLRGKTTRTQASCGMPTETQTRKIAGKCMNPQLTQDSWEVHESPADATHDPYNQRQQKSFAQTQKTLSPKEKPEHTPKKATFITRKVS